MPSPKSWRFILPLSMLVVLALAVGVAVARDPFPPVKGNPADRMLSVPMDDYEYDHAKRCYKHPRKGALALTNWLEHNAGGVFWGIMRCEKWGKNKASLHAEGRAIDWHLDAGSAGQRKEAYRLIRLMLATDKAGNPHALARRMGVQEIIFDCKSWWTGMPALGKYSVCYKPNGKRRKSFNRTAAHMDHIHFGLSKRGAAMKTSFWKRAGKSAR